MTHQPQDPSMSNAIVLFDNALLPRFSTAQDLATFISNSEGFSSETDIAVANVDKGKRQRGLVGW